jgi:hypothetical protein
MYLEGTRDDMSDPTIPIDHDALSGLLTDPLMTRMVTVVNLTSLSILELLEYGFTRKDVSRAMAKGVIEFDKPMVSEVVRKRDVVEHILETEDYYFELLSSKIRLAKLGLFMLEIIEADEKLATMAPGDVVRPAEEEETLFHQSAPHVQL